MNEGVSESMSQGNSSVFIIKGFPHSMNFISLDRLCIALARVNSSAVPREIDPRVPSENR